MSLSITLGSLLGSSDVLTAMALPSSDGASESSFDGDLSNTGDAGGFSAGVSSASAGTSVFLGDAASSTAFSASAAFWGDIVAASSSTLWATSSSAFFLAAAAASSSAFLAAAAASSSAFFFASSSALAAAATKAAASSSAFFFCLLFSSDCCCSSRSLCICFVLRYFLLRSLCSTCFVHGCIFRRCCWLTFLFDFRLCLVSYSRF
mmetsp:Transcript_1011/g.1601  ORF Transcript_1011/g.1601 Transcript_1011/m.1601 type:complete len:206 (+) Transcript_1011:835-1452(+)